MPPATTLSEVVPGHIWTQQRTLWFGGVRLRSRTTVVRLRDGTLWVHSPAPSSDEVCRALEALGRVAWIVVPNKFHHLNAPAMKQRYPGATLVAPASVRPRNDQLVFERDISDPQLAADLPDFRALPLAGVPFLDETTFFHEPSGTLIAADLIMCGCKDDHWSWRWVSRAFGQYGKHKLPPDVWMHTKPSAELRRSLDAMLSLPLRRILVAHSDPIEQRPEEQLAEGWRFALR